jgi:hypothetical protein
MWIEVHRIYWPENGKISIERSVKFMIEGEETKVNCENNLDLEISENATMPNETGDISTSTHPATAPHSKIAPIAPPLDHLGADFEDKE